MKVLVDISNKYISVLSYDNVWTWKGCFCIRLDNLKLAYDTRKSFHSINIG